MKGDFTRDSFDPARHYTGVLMQQGRVQLDADWNEQGAIARHQLRSALADLIGPFGGPNTRLGFQITPVAGANGVNNFNIGVGHYYVSGMLCENAAQLSYTAQAGYPFSADTDTDRLQQSGRFMVYLDVWERHVSFAEADGMREIALGGPDTSSRVQLVWQVKALPGAADAKAIEALNRPSAARLRADALAPAQAREACVIHAQARYRGAENQLYRVEIHRGGTAMGLNGAAGATFKWSRENGSVLFAVREALIAIDGATGQRSTTVTLKMAGRDDKLGITAGDWVELLDEASTLRDQPGTLLKVRSVDGLAVMLDGAPSATPGSFGAAYVVLRRWDQGAANVALDQGALPVAESAATWIELENGVMIQFAPGTAAAPVEYRAGDYWLIPARTASGDVEWPVEAGSGQPQALPPAGGRHYYAPLASVAVSTTGWAVTEQRSAFAPLAVAL